MGDDEATPDETQHGVTADTPSGVRGECPICGVEFDEADAFRDHLGEAHGLYDEEGATTGLWTPDVMVAPLATTEPSSAVQEALAPIGAERPRTEEPVAVPEPTEVPAGDRGECPICGVEFDDADAFRDHLGEVHGLYDEEGASTGLWTPEVMVVPLAATEPTIPEFESPPPRVVAAPPQERPVGLIVLVLMLVIGLVGAVALSIGSDDGSDNVAQNRNKSSADARGSRSAAPHDTKPTDRVSTSTTSSSSTTSSPVRADTVGEARRAPTRSRPRAPVPVTHSGTTTTTAPVTTTSPPPPAFVAPTTRSARIDKCSRDKSQWIVTYSWHYVGGTGWSPLSAYNATGGGRYQHAVAVPRNGNTPITTVGVLDSRGTRHDIALSPTLSANSC